MILKHNFHKMGNKRNVKTYSLTFEEQIKKFSKLYSSEFEPYCNKQTKRYKTYGISNEEQEWHIKSINQLLTKYKLFIEICTII